MRLKKQYDVIIVGTGVAGLNTALALQESLDVVILSKDYAWECNTFYAQGGVAVAKNTEDISLHVKDTLEAGAHLNDPKAVETLCQNGPEAIDDLIRLGFEFDKDERGQLLYTQEAAHSTNRVLHAGGDATGRELHLFLMQQVRCPIIYNTQVIDLLIQDGQCSGVEVRNNDKVYTIGAKKVVLASGGVGSLYAYHTNARTISADMHGICLQHDMKLQDMEMMQFHPTVFVQSNAVRKQLLSEALRGEGAHVVDSDGYRFLFEYDKRAELSPRSIVSRAIFDYVQNKKKEVFLDVSGFEKEHFKTRFPSIYFNMKNLGYDLPSDKIPISPAFHYSMGGLKTNIDGTIDNIKDLYAIGELASVGVHGANRLASNSLLEGLVFSKLAAKSIQASYEEKKGIISFTCKEDTLIEKGDKALKNELRALMWESVGIVRSPEKLKKALNRVEEMLKLPTGKLIKLRLLTSREIILSALRRKESLGAHYIQ